MRLLDRYVGRTVISATLLALLVLLTLDTLFTVTEELEEVGRGDYGLAQAAAYIALTLPRRAYELFPSAVLLGALAGLGSLAAGSELVVVRAAGVSRARVVWAALKAGLVMVIAAVVVGEALAPAAEQYAERRKTLAQTQRVLAETREGFWVRHGPDFINFRRILPGPRLADLTIYEFDADYRLRRAVHARSAHYASGRWVLEEVRYSRLKDDGVVKGRAPRSVRASFIDPALLEVVIVDPERLSASGLRRYARYMRENGLDAGRYELAFWIRVMSPLSSLVMLLVAMPFVFGPLRAAGLWHRILAGVLIGVLFYVLNQTLNHLGLVYGLHPFVSAVLPPLIFLIAALEGLRRLR